MILTIIYIYIYIYIYMGILNGYSARHLSFSYSLIFPLCFYSLHFECLSNLYEVIG